jgi:hypothetical protein
MLKGLFFLLFIQIVGSNLLSQNYSGIYRGYILVKTNNEIENKNIRFEFEMQINQHASNLIEGVTYTYRKNEYSAKAYFKGKIKNNTIAFDEFELVDLKKNSASDNCLMSCYGKIEFRKNITQFVGTFTSKNSTGLKKCSSGMVNLIKVEKSIFKEEKFLQKKDIKLKTKENDAFDKKHHFNKIEKKSREEIEDSTQKVNSILPKGNQLKKNILTLNKKFSSASLSTLLNKNLIKTDTIFLSEETINIDFFDNGIIDNDTISVYINGELFFDKVRITNKAKSFFYDFSKNDSILSILAVAHNLGEIPPNTSLLVINNPKFRKEIPVVVDNNTCLEIILQYKIPKVGIKRF